MVPQVRHSWTNVSDLVDLDSGFSSRMDIDNPGMSRLEHFLHICLFKCGSTRNTVRLATSVTFRAIIRLIVELPLVW